MTGTRKWVWWLVTLATLLAAPQVRAAPPVTGGTRVDASHEKAVRSGFGKQLGNVCGPLCLYVFLRMQDRRTQLQDVLDIDYYADERPGNIEQLVAIAKKNGVVARPFQNLTPAHLRWSPKEMILHVKESAQRRDFSHFVLFIRMEGDAALVFDVLEESVVRIPLCDLSGLWDGQALILSTSPLTFADRFRIYVVPFLLPVGILAVALLSLTSALRLGASFRTKPRAVTRFAVLSGSALQMCAILVAVFLSALIYHRTASAGLLVNSKLVGDIQQAYSETFWRIVATERVKDWLTKGDVVIVDARLPRDYDLGHLPGALNIPVGSSASVVQQALAGVPIDTEIVVYCQSDRCSYDTKVAMTLLGLGYRRIWIYGAGWNEWKTVM